MSGGCSHSAVEGGKTDDVCPAGASRMTSANLYP
jgi:hypothetical protein